MFSSFSLHPLKAYKYFVTIVPSLSKCNDFKIYINTMRSICNKTIEARHSVAHTTSQYNHRKQRPQVCVLPCTTHKTRIQPVLENTRVSFQNWPQPSSFSWPVTAMVWKQPGRTLRTTGDLSEMLHKVVQTLQTNFHWGFFRADANHLHLLPLTTSEGTVAKWPWGSACFPPPVVAPCLYRPWCHSQGWSRSSLSPVEGYGITQWKSHQGELPFHSIPQAIHRWLEVPIMPKLLAGLLAFTLHPLRFFYHLECNLPFYPLFDAGFKVFSLWQILYFAHSTTLISTTGTYYFIDCVEFIPSLHRKSLIDVTYRGKVKVNALCGCFLLLVLLFAAVLSPLGCLLTHS